MPNGGTIELVGAKNTGGSAVASNYRPLANTGSGVFIPLNSAIQRWATEHIRESFEAYAEFIREAGTTDPLAVLDFVQVVPTGVIEPKSTDIRALGGVEAFTTANWDGEDAIAIDPRDLKYARELLREIGHHIPTQPDAAPGADGSICMEWIGQSAAGLKKIFVDVGPGDQVLTFARFGKSNPIERHFKKDSTSLVPYLLVLFDSFVSQ
jgi:hypothetical protein